MTEPRRVTGPIGTAVVTGVVALLLAASRGRQRAPGGHRRTATAPGVEHHHRHGTAATPRAGPARGRERRVPLRADPGGRGPVASREGRHGRRSEVCRTRGRGRDPRDRRAGLPLRADLLVRARARLRRYGHRPAPRLGLLCGRRNPGHGPPERLGRPPRLPGHERAGGAPPLPGAVRASAGRGVGRRVPRPRLRRVDRHRRRARGSVEPAVDLHRRAGRAGRDVRGCLCRDIRRGAGLGPRADVQLRTLAIRPRGTAAPRPPFAPLPGPVVAALPPARRRVELRHLDPRRGDQPSARRSLDHRLRGQPAQRARPPTWRPCRRAHHERRSRWRYQSGRGLLRVVAGEVVRDSTGRGDRDGWMPTRGARSGLQPPVQRAGAQQPGARLPHRAASRLGPLRAELDHPLRRGSGATSAGSSW